MVFAFLVEEERKIFFVASYHFIILTMVHFLFILKKYGF